MVSCKVIDSAQTAEWNECIALLADKDIYFSSRYCRLYEKEEEQWAKLFVYRRDELLVAYPYLLRSITHLPAIQELGLEGEWFDISTPYGYGGPLTNAIQGSERKDLFREFSEAFAVYCRENRILTEFVRFHPLINNAHDYVDLELEWNRNTAFIDLQAGSEEELLRRYCRNHKTNIRRLYASALTVRRIQPTQRMDTFIDLYYGTLQYLQADSFYYFPRTYIEETCELLKDQLEMFEVMNGNETVAACLIIHEGRWMHYHLSGWNRDYLHLAPTKMLIHAAALWGMENGFEKFHLGGGYTGNDKLYNFKRGFGSENKLDYFLGKRVFFPEIYGQISTQFENLLHDTPYFPVYRHPQLIIKE